MGERRYWSVQECGWVASPSAGDALVTPWSAHGLPVPSGRAAPRDGSLDGCLDVYLDGYEVAGVPRPAADVPGQRAADGRRPASR